MAWAICFITGSRLPYIYTDLAFKLRGLIIFPALFCIFGYFAFVYKRPGAKSGYDLAMDSLRSSAAKIKSTLLGMLGLFFLTGILSWTSIAFTAWLAELIASTPFSQTYTISKITANSGPVWSTTFDLTLIRDKSEIVDLRLNRVRYEEYSWKTGDVICIRGRTSVFGSIVDTTSRGFCD